MWGREGVLMMLSACGVDHASTYSLHLAVGQPPAAAQRASVSAVAGSGPCREPSGFVQQAQAFGLSLLAGSLLCVSTAAPVAAENELATLAGSKSTSELVKPQCFAESCKQQTEACAESRDCMKGLTCSAKCMGDSQCTLGCFARYGNKVLDDVLQCTIEDAGCIKIAIMEPGGDSPLEAPLPPKPLIAATPASMQGRWYKVMGWNSNYDCFECQRNSFSKPSAQVVSSDIGSQSVDVEVEYSLPRMRVGQAPTTAKQVLHEKLEFDTTPGSRRTAHTEGRMFGLTFWENWYLIGENQRSEPQFKFVYYTGKTLQNRYDGAFVYARKPELPRESLPHIYRIAREAGFEPTDFCAIDNKCFSAPANTVAQPPLFTPVAVADTGPAQPSLAQAAVSPLRAAVTDLREFFEDPRPPAQALYDRQRKMSSVREYDSNGYRLPSKDYRSRL